MTDTWFEVTDHEEPSTWNIQMDGFFRAHVERQMLADDMSQEAIDSVFSNAVRITISCVVPKDSQKEPQGTLK